MKTFTVDYEENELEYRVLKELFLTLGVSEALAQKLAWEYSKHIRNEVESFQKRSHIVKGYNMKNTFISAQEASNSFKKLGEAFNKIPEIKWKPKSKIQKIIDFF